jgi:hypothetical protein
LNTKTITVSKVANVIRECVYAGSIEPCRAKFEPMIDRSKVKQISPWKGSCANIGADVLCRFTVEVTALGLER